MNIDPEMIMGGVNWSVQLIGLLSAWKQDRSATSDNQFQEFILWLEDHNFQEVSRKIAESDELNRELHALLALSLDQVSGKLDELAFAVAGLAVKIDGLNTLDRAISHDTDTLSTQAREILKLFADQPGCPHMIVGPTYTEHPLIFIPENVSFTMDEPRFVPDDIDSLERADLISQSDYTPSGSPIFSLTRLGAQLAKSFPTVEINEPPVVPGPC
ncbi:MAG: hypothetical protein ABIS50_21145 [Luteolibacter sp.]|uniref:hypothetical protein n=1 Tax=Luteolibacter sp. TaxID=1962973 RepID=UPI0032634431